MNNEHHFYHSRNARRTPAPDFLPSGNQPKSYKKIFDEACDRLRDLMAHDEYLRFIRNEVGGAWDEMIGAVEGEILRIEAEINASMDILADFPAGSDPDETENMDIDREPMGGR